MNKREKEKKLRELYAQVKKYEEDAEREHRNLTTADYKAMNAILDQMEELRDQVDTEERIEDWNKPTTENPDANSGPIYLNGYSEASSRPGSGPCQKKDYRSMFGLERNLDRGGFRDAEEFLRAVWSNRADQRLVTLQQRAMSEGTGSEGGFSVPSEFSARWLDSFIESEIVRPRAEVWPMQSKTISVPGFDDKAHTNNLFGGIIAYWGSENAAMTETAPVLRKIELNAKKLYIYATTSNELLADGVNFDAQLNNAMIKAGGWYLDLAFLDGSGGNQPLGVLNGDSLIQVDKESGQAENTITYSNLTTMFSRLHPACMRNAVWVANSTIIPQLCQLTIVAGTGGAVIQAMTSDNGQFSILTRPVLFTEKLPALGNANCIVLADFSQYVIGMRKELTIDRSPDIYFNKDQMAFRLILRADGQPKWSDAVTPKHGDSLSPFVGIEATNE